MTTSLKYSLNDISEISAVGFTYIIPDKTIEMINYLTYQIGSSTVIPSNIFEKRELVNVSGDTAFVNKNGAFFTHSLKSKKVDKLLTRKLFLISMRPTKTH